MTAYGVFSKKEDLAIVCAVKDGKADWGVLSGSLERAEEVVIQRAFQLGLVQFGDYQHVLLSHRADGWRSDEIAYLISNAGKLSTKAMANVLDRSIASVSKQLFEFRLTNGQSRDWDEWELDLLETELAKNGVTHVSRKTFRSQMDVRYTAISMGIVKQGIELIRLGAKRKHEKVESAA